LIVGRHANVTKNAPSMMAGHFFVFRWHQYSARKGKSTGIFRIDRKRENRSKAYILFILSIPVNGLF
jgi:hypothetical protein